MGRPKALLPWPSTDGVQPLVRHVASLLDDVVDELIVVSSQELQVAALFEHSPIAARIVTDRQPRLGPLGGLREGLSVATSEYAFVTSTDTPFLSARFVDFMFGFGCTAAPIVDAFVQPLCAVYRTGLDAEADRLITAKRMRPLFLLEADDYRRVAESELPDRDSCRDLNDPQTYLDALDRLSRNASAPESSVTIECRELPGRTLRHSPAALGDILMRLQSEFSVRDLLTGSGEPRSGYSLCLNGHDIAPNLAMPIGPGERLLIRRGR